MSDATAPPADAAPAPAPPRTSPREAAALLAVLALAGALHLLRPNREAHLYAVPLAGPVAYAFNADSAPFARLVITFPRGFDDCEQGRARLMRPLYPAAGWILYQALRPAAGLIPDRWAAQVAAIAARANHPEIWRGIDGRDLVVDFLLVPSTEPLNLLLPAVAVYTMAVT